MVKCAREVMEILEAYDLTQCAHSAAQLVGCDEKTVPAMSSSAMPAVTRRVGRVADDRPVPGQDRGAGGGLTGPDPRGRGHEKLTAMGFGH